MHAHLMDKRMMRIAGRSVEQIAKGLQRLSFDQGACQDAELAEIVFVTDPTHQAGPGGIEASAPRETSEPCRFESFR